MIRSWLLIWDLACKDWKLFLSDRRAALLCFAVPILLASVFGLIFDRPGQRMNSCKLPLLVVNEDTHPYTQQVIKDLTAADQMELRLVDRATAEQEVAQRKTGVAVVFQAGFGENLKNQLQQGKRPTLELIHHPLCHMESQWAEGLLTEVILQRTAREFLAPLGLAGKGPLDRPFQVERSTIPAEATHPFNSYSHSFCGMTLQYLLFWGMESGLLLLRERQRGIWRRLRATPVSLRILLMARLFSTAWIALLQVLATFAFGYLVFGVKIQGSVVGFLMLALGISLLAAATGLCVAALGGTEARARSLFIVVILAVSMLGGLWLPAFLLPSWVRDLAQTLPTTWAMRGLDAVTWQGSNWRQVFPSILAVSIFTLVFLILASIRFWRMEIQQKKGAVL